MTQVEFLTKQTEDAYDWTNKIIESIPFAKWDTIPSIVESNVSWQIGHLIMSHYFHSVMVIAGHQMDIIQKIPIKEYGKFYTNALPKDSVGKVDLHELLKNLKFVQQRSIEIISKLSDEELENDLEQTPTKHPIAKIKKEAIDWNIKHTMYHCGQIGLLKRVVDERYDFGLRLGE